MAFAAEMAYSGITQWRPDELRSEADYLEELSRIAFQSEMAKKGAEIASNLQSFHLEGRVLPDMLTEQLLLKTLMDNAKSDPSMALVCTAITELQAGAKDLRMAAGKLDPIIGSVSKF